MQMQVESLSSVMGAEVRSVDLNRSFSGEEFAAIERVFLDHLLVVFKDQRLTAEKQVEFSARFGQLDIHVLTQYNHPQHPEVFVLSNVVVDGKPIGIADGGSYWHSDFAFKERPAKATLLNAQEIPAAGGNTLFVNMYAAYEGLSDEWKARLAPLQVIHRYRAFEKKKEQGTRVQLTEEQKKATPDVIHPLVRTHPQTGRKALFVHPGMSAAIVGLPEAESDAILEYLFAHCVQDEYVFTFQWSPGDVVVWDNRCTMHKATTRDLPAHLHRTIYRTTVLGERPV